MHAYAAGWAQPDTGASAGERPLERPHASCRASSCAERRVIMRPCACRAGPAPRVALGAVPLVTAAHMNRDQHAPWRLWHEHAWPGALPFTRRIMHTDTRGAPAPEGVGLGMWTGTQHAE